MSYLLEDMEKWAAPKVELDGFYDIEDTEFKKKYNSHSEAPVGRIYHNPNLPKIQMRHKKDDPSRFEIFLKEQEKTAAAEEDEDRKKEKRRNIVGGVASAIGLGAGLDQIRRSNKHKTIAKDFVQKAQEATTHANNSRSKAALSKSLAEALDSEIVKANQRQSGATKIEDVLNASSKVQNSKAQVDWLKNKYDYASKATATLANRTDINAKRWTPGRHMNHYQENLKLLGRELNEMMRDSAYSQSDLADQRRDIKKTTFFQNE